MRQLFQTMFRDIFSEKSEKNYFQENAHVFLGTDQVMRKPLPGCVFKEAMVQPPYPTPLCPPRRCMQNMRLLFKPFYVSVSCSESRG